MTSLQPRVFYGWYVLSVLVLSGVMAAGTAQLFMGAMLKPISEDFGWSRSAIAGAVTLGNLVGGLASPLVGRLTDRYGSRVLTSVGALGTALAYVALAGLSQLWQYYVVFIIGRGVSVCLLGGVVPATAATNWFRRMRGRAIGVVSLSNPLGGAVLALLAVPILEWWSWREVFLVFGLVTLGLVVPASALVLRRRPEDLGLRPDGDPVTGAAEPATAQPAGKAEGGGLSGRVVRREAPGGESSWSLREALHTRALWLIAISVSISHTATSGIAFHQTAYFTDIGIAPALALVALSVAAFMGAVGNGVWGLLTERFSARYLAVLGLLLSAASSGYLLLVRDFGGALLAATLFGLTSRGWSSLCLVLLARYFGRTSYGAINGFVQPFLSAGLGSGPLTAGIFFDLTGSYRIAFLLFAAGFLVSGILFWLAKAPVRKGEAVRSATVSSAVGE